MLILGRENEEMSKVYFCQALRIRREWLLFDFTDVNPSGFGLSVSSSVV